MRFALVRIVERQRMGRGLAANLLATRRTGERLRLTAKVR
jgi:hypothetical protein